MKYYSIAVLLCITFVFLLARPAESAYTIINTEEQFQSVTQEARNLLQTHFGIVIRGPVKFKLSSAKELDDLYRGIYRGNQVGLERTIGGVHEVYVMKDMDGDRTLATTVHELVHAWQNEVSPGQDIVVKEGFAVWVEYKILDKTGAYALANAMRNNIADPVYGVGFKKVLEWEQKLGEKELVLKIRNVKTINDEI